jgi:hypothetical protein
MKTITKIASIALMGLLPYIGIQAQNKANITQTEIVSEKLPIMRNEIVVSGMPLNSDAYAYWEHQNSDMYRLRLESLPLGYGLLSLGAVAQHVRGATGRQEIGAVLRAKGSIDDALLKADTRFFPSNKEFDAYWTANGSKFYGDIFTIWNLGAKKLTIRPGADYKINQNFYVGAEAKFSGVLPKIRPEYFGLRGKLAL